MFRALAPALLFFACSCSAVATQALRPSAPAETQAVLSLFSSDEAVLSDQEIARILDTEWHVPNSIRIAVLPLGHSSAFGVRAPESGMETSSRAVATLREIPGVFDVSYLPEFLRPARPDVAHIREAAARGQADWAFIYSSKAQSSAHWRAFGPDQVDGVSLIECALLDTRSGLIVFTSRSTQPFQLTEKSSGESWSAMIERAEREAVDDGLVDDAARLAAFIAKARRGQSGPLERG